MNLNYQCNINKYNNLYIYKNFNSITENILTKI